MHKPFEATQGRIDRARREGDTARSSDLCAVCAFGAGTLAAILLMPPLMNAAAEALVAAARGGIAIGAYASLAGSAVAVGCGSLAGATAATVIQSGRVSFVFPKLQISRLNPAAGVRRMFSRDAVAGAGKATVAAGVATLFVAPAVGDTLAAAAYGATPARIVALIATALPRILAALIALGLGFGVIDVFVARSSWRKRIRMSFEEFREDQKQHEGDPLMRSRRRATHRMLVRGSIERLGEAAFVIANPTHVAIALEYRPPEVEVPRVLLRAIDAGALEVRRRAEVLRIPVVEDRPLAHMLLAQTQIGGYIPNGLYVPIARIVAALMPLLTHE